MIGSSGSRTKPKEEVDIGDTARKIKVRKGPAEERAFVMSCRAN